MTELEALRARVAQLTAALAPFAKLYLWPDDTLDPADDDFAESIDDTKSEDLWITRGWIRAAREALKEDQTK